jgi:2'-5' RNA ligase
MPYLIRRRGGKHCVVKEDDGKVMGCHDTRKEAEDQRRAIHANEGDSAAMQVGPETGELAMVALYPRAEEAADLAIEGGLEAGDLHVTLVFLGDAETLEEQEIHEAVSTAALVNDALAGTVGGVGFFAENEDGIPVILLPDVQGMTRLREDVVSELRIHGIESPSEHGFLPHMTLTYAEEPETPDVAYFGTPLHFDTVSVVVGDRRTDYPLERFADQEAETMETKDAMQMTLTGPWGTIDIHPSSPNVPLPATTAAAAAAQMSALAQGGISGQSFIADGFVSVVADTTEAANEAPLRWRGPIAFEGVPTDDNTPTPRIIMPGAMSWRELPIPLMAVIEDKGGGHAGQKLAGRIDEIWREERPDLGEGVVAIMGSGVFDSRGADDEIGEFGAMIGRLVRERTLRGVSIDPVAVEWALIDAETMEPADLTTLTPDDVVEGRFYAAMVSGKIAAATVCAMQAIDGATIEILVASGQASIRTGYLEIVEDEPLVSCAAGPIAPPAAWFEKKTYRQLTPFFVTDEGQVGGHLQSRDCHVGYEDRCIRAPRSRDGYLRFHSGNLVSAEGEHLKVGRVQVKPHASSKMSIDEAIAYYSDPETVGAFVVIWDDEFGIACAGVTRSNASPELLRDFYANPPSGEWRRGELMGFSSVPLPGLPVVAPQAYIVASASGDEVEMLLLPGVTENDVCEECEPTEADVLVAAAAIQGPEALLEIISA